jgi:phosphoribosylformylglycinamidine cyclo-ligase
LRPLEELEWKAAAHITGGGLLGNLPRVLPHGLGARLERGSWDVPRIFDVIARRGRVAEEEMLGTFNLGLGMVLVCAEPPAGLPVVGRVVEHSAGARVVVA